MKKTCVSLIMAAMLLLISCVLSVSARTIPTVDQNFDDGQYSFAQTDMNGSKAECYISDVESGGKALVVKQLSSYAHFIDEKPNGITVIRPNRKLFYSC